MKTKTKKRVMLTLALAIIMTCAMSITALAATKVTGLKQTKASEYSVSFSWAADTSANGYYIYVSTDNVNYTRKGNTTSTYPDVYEPNGIVTNLSPGTTYYIKVQSATKNASGVYVPGPMSDALAVTTAPTKVTTFKQLKATTKGVTLKWSKVAGATSYKIYRDNKVVATTTATNATIKQTVGTNKYYKVVAVRKVGNFSVEGNYASTYADAVPAKPVYVANSAKSNLRWNPNTNEVTLYADKNTKDTTVDGFQFVVYSVDGKKKLKTYTTTATYNPMKFTLKAVKNKGFQVMARGYANINGKKCWGAWSAKQVIIPQPKVAAELDGSHAAKIRWAKVSGATKYYIYVAKNQSSTYNLASSKFKRVATVNSKTTSYKITGLQTGKYLCVYVVPQVKVGKKAYNGLKDYFWSWYYYTYYTY
ncbi:MAG: fibronectin type III domain-containing protein [Lachnospiraceae bacterium]|nr:fibronectin type III domain-containing protein [Lachnospiraceae bacterium]